jgi:hypothetical protein
MHADAVTADVRWSALALLEACVLPACLPEQYMPYPAVFWHAGTNRFQK